jgi:hypothetical protein
MKTYVGKVQNSDWDVFVIEGPRSVAKRLDPGYKHANHSPDGFAWGYGGSGPAQTAFALLLDTTGNIDRALAAYQDFKWEVIAKLPMNENFRLTESEVLSALQCIEEKYARR